ncbi:MAG: hypothetical protein GWN81_13620, partial [Phycisphaerae bacterium]|nr:hypothetical protein [Phycisphaerae bacterium]NIW46862.1 hypothetical protein [Gammaproteobacteria bacterium]NIP53298.1 hypothetical protein [Phycisphaerae bacterium]NIU09858.1 hypothetical protein [Phycisphaerae bacterium]NIW99635.1 hypothetical protein [Phycisphaerae bacterium]
YGKLYTAIDLAIMSDLDGNNYPEIAVLGKDSSDGLRVQARDSMTDSVTSTTYFGANAFPVDLEIISNYVAGTIPAVAVHARVWAS